MKRILNIILNIILLISVAWILPCCGNNGGSSDTTGTDLVDVSSSDRTIQSYIPEPQKALLNRGSLTFDDMVTSNRLLINSTGWLKGIEMSDGYHEITSYRCFPIGSGWYFVECKYLNDDRTYDWECYIRENLH